MNEQKLRVLTGRWGEYFNLRRRKYFVFRNSTVYASVSIILLLLFSREKQNYVEGIVFQQEALKPS
jgi:hypothetical protein